MDRTDFVDLCKKGDEQALNSLYNTYSGKMMKICLRYVPDKQIAQDLLHDGFIVIFSSIGSLRNPERLESWMGVIMKNTVLRYLNQSNSTYTVPLSEMCEEDEPADNPLVTEFISYDRTGGTLAGRILKSFQTGSARRIIPQRNRRSTEYSPSFIIFSTASRKSPAKKDDRQLPLDSHPVVTVLHSIVQLS